MKVFLFCLFLVGSVFVYPVIAFAQRSPNRTPIPDPYQEYLYKVDTFVKDRRTFETNVNQYRTYQTLQSRDTALNSSIQMLYSGQQALVEYTLFLTQKLRAEIELNSRVKNRILSDMETHRAFLSTYSTNIQNIARIEDAQTAGQGLVQRYSYTRTTTSQALAYIDASILKQRIDKSRNIVSQLSSLVAGFPENNRQKNIVDRWAQDSQSELVEIEKELVFLVENMYPDKDNPYFESGGQIGSNRFNNTKDRLNKIISRFDEILRLAEEGYQEL